MDSDRDIIQYLSERDPATCDMLEGIHAGEEKNVGEMAELLDALPA